MSNIPSDEDFARTERLDRERWRNLDEVSKNVKRHFERKCPLHDIFLFPEGGNFRACVFFSGDTDLELCIHNGITQEIEDFVFAELERAGRGAMGKIAVAFEFDSDERVNAEFEGDYFNCRLRAGSAEVWKVRGGSAGPLRPCAGPTTFDNRNGEGSLATATPRPRPSPHDALASGSRRRRLRANELRVLVGMSSDGKGDKSH